MKFGPLLCFFSLIPFCLIAQKSYNVKGTLVDSSAGMLLKNTTITILNAQDSTLYDFKWTKGNADFQFANMRPGKFILIASARNYADYINEFSLDSLHPSHDFQQIKLLLKSRILTEVIIQGKTAALKLNGDTLEYNASAFITQPNAKVEDLLKQFPGIEVDQNGHIRAQGKTVSKVLLDGEEFFGDDPVLVTRNIRADMVDVVQVYDGSNEQAVYSGASDTKKEKRLNIKLKEDKKHGQFGQVALGGGTDGYYSGKGMYNYFNGKERLSIFGNIDNTGKLGLNNGENDKYGMSRNTTMLGDQGVVIVLGDNKDELETASGRYGGEGLPEARTMGIHYDNKLNDDKVTVNGNYRLGALTVDGSKESLIQNNLPSSYISTISNQSFHNYIFRQALDGAFNFQLDSTSSLKITVGGADKNITSNNYYNTGSTRLDGSLLNTNNRSTSNKGDKYVFSASALYTKSFKKPGRTFVLNVHEDYNNSKSQGHLFSVINYYNTSNAIDSAHTIDQNKQLSSDNAIFGASGTWSEPLSKKFGLIFSYNIVTGNGTSDQRTFSKSDGDKYDMLDSTYSSNYKLKQLSNQGGLSLKYSTSKVNASILAAFTNVSLNQFDYFRNQAFKRSYLNFNPQAEISYRLGQSASLSANYWRNTNLPNLAQMQPLAINNDPLNVLVGNPGLKPSYSNDINMSYNTYSMVRARMIWINVYYSIQTTPVVSDVTTDNTGTSIWQYANIDKNAHTFNVIAVYDKNFQSAGISITNNAALMSGDGYNMVNSVLNKSTSYEILNEVEVKKRKDNKYTVGLSATPEYFIRKSSLQASENGNGTGFVGKGFVDLTLPSRFYFSTNAEYRYRSRTNAFNTHLERFLWNASISRTFLKHQNLRVSLSANDLLNQNKGFDRSVTNNTIIQNNFTTIKRYFMLTATWDFSRMKSAGTK
jgi:outer membrane receptor protein involved in Fe transport